MRLDTQVDAPRARVETLTGPRPPPSVFSDREKLRPRHIPGTLPHREHQTKALRNLFHGFLERPGGTYQQVAQLLGPIGSGKTSTANRFGLQYQRAAQEKGIPLRYIHVNCKLEARSSFTLYRTLLERAAPEAASRGQSPGEMLRLLVDTLRREGRYLLLALDDVDHLIRRQKAEEPEGGVVYDLTRLNEIHLGEHQNVAGVIFIAQDESFRDLLDPSERSSLGCVAVRLRGYDAGQLRDILTARAEEAFTPGAVDEEVIGYVADLAAGESRHPGDCRFALDLLLSAGLTADAEHSLSVNLEHVRRAVGETIWGMSGEDLLALDEHSVSVLKGAIQALSFEGAPYVNLRTVHQFYSVACETRGLRPLSYSRVRELALGLHRGGLIDYRKNRGLGVAGASLEDLSRILGSLEERRPALP